MKRGGTADLPLHGGHVPKWLAVRMTELGGVIVESLVHHYGKSEVLTRLADPFWFQAFGAVMGMDWHSSGITTSVMGALKRAINPRSEELGLYVCGGRGKHSRRTPEELLAIGERTGMDADALVRASKLTAKVDSTAIQDGHQLYLHSFVVSDEAEWVVVQQGMNERSRTARRYHWASSQIRSFVDEPHAAILGESSGPILNLVAHQAQSAQAGILDVMAESPERALANVKRVLSMPAHHDIYPRDVDLKRLGAVVALSHDSGVRDFASALLLRGMGPRTLQSLALVSEVIHGTPVRFRDPARFAFAHGGKDGFPFPVLTKVMDETTEVVRRGIEKAKIGNSEKSAALKRLHRIAQTVEQGDMAQLDFRRYVRHEKANAYRHGGRTVKGKSKPPATPKNPQQPELFDFEESD